MCDEESTFLRKLCIELPWRENVLPVCRHAPVSCWLWKKRCTFIEPIHESIRKQWGWCICCKSHWNEWLQTFRGTVTCNPSEGQCHSRLLINKPAVEPDLSSDARPECSMQLPWLPAHVLRLQWCALEFLYLVPFFRAAEMVELQRLFSLCQTLEPGGLPWNIFNPVLPHL